MECPPRGVVLLDGSEVVISNDKGFSSHDLIDPHPLEIVELLIHNGVIDKSAVSWKIASRNLPGELSQIISQAIAKPIEELGLARQQQLICRGLQQELES